MSIHPANQVDIHRLISNLIRVGTVEEISGDKARIKTGENLTDWIHWMTPRAGDARVFWRPSIGEQVVILALNGDLSTSVFIPAIFQDKHPAPIDKDKVHHVVYPDNSIFEYDANTSTLTIKKIKKLIIEADEEITIDCPQTTFPQGDFTHSGGNLSSHGKILHTHVHKGVIPGGANTQGPA